MVRIILTIAVIVSLFGNAVSQQRQSASGITAHYHQPSDEMRDTWDYHGMIQEAEIALAIGRRISDMPEKPRFNPGDEFAKKP